MTNQPEQPAPTKSPFYVRARITKRRLEVLQTIWRVASKKGRPPSMQELADEMGMPDRQSAHNHVLVLRHKQLVDWVHQQPRTLRITEPGLKLLGKEPQASSSDAIPQA